MYICPGFSIEEKKLQCRTMTQQLRWEDIEAAFNEYLQGLSDEEFNELEAWLHQEQQQQALIDEFLEPTPFERQRDGVQGQLHSYKKTVSIPELHKDLLEFHNFIRPEVMEILENESRALGPFKFRLEIVVNTIKQTDAGIVEFNYFTVQREPILVNAFNPRTVSRLLNEVAEAQAEALAIHNQNGSGLIVEGITAAYLRISDYNPFRGGSYIALPKFIKAKGAVINVKNKDDQCLR